jgi:hypothetical protein
MVGQNGDCPPENRDATALSSTQAPSGSVPHFPALPGTVPRFARDAFLVGLSPVFRGAKVPGVRGLG